MSIGFLKRLLSLAKLAAILSIVGAAYGYWDHHQEMDVDGGWKAPDFRPSVKPPMPTVARIEAIAMQLGRFQKEVPVDTTADVEQPKEEIKAALAKLGVIKSAIAAFPPYTESRPAIIFEFRQAPAGSTETIRTIELGQARPTPTPAPVRAPVVRRTGPRPVVIDPSTGPCRKSRARPRSSGWPRSSPRAARC